MHQDTFLIQSAEKIVSNSLGRPVVFTSTERLTGPDGSKTLYRCFAAPGSQPASSFIIKTAARPSSSITPFDAWEMRGFRNDWMGAEFLSSLHSDDPISPLFYGGDLRQGFYVMEDLGVHSSLVDALLYGDAV